MKLVNCRTSQRIPSNLFAEWAIVLNTCGISILLSVGFESKFSMDSGIKQLDYCISFFILFICQTYSSFNEFQVLLSPCMCVCKDLPTYIGMHKDCTHMHTHMHMHRQTPTYSTVLNNFTGVFVFRLRTARSLRRPGRCGERNT